MGFIALLPSILNIAICLAIYKILASKFSKTMSITLAIAASLLLGFNIRIFSIGQELFSEPEKNQINNVTIDLVRNGPISISGNTQEIRFKKNIFDSLSHTCNESVGCSFRKPEMISENIAKKVLNSGLRIANDEKTRIHLNVTEVNEDGSGTYSVTLLDGETVLAKENYRRRIYLPGGDFLLDRDKEDKNSLRRYIATNTLWDHILRSLFNKEQKPFLNEFLEKHIKVSKPQRTTKTLKSSITPLKQLNKKHQIVEFQNTYKPVGCNDQDINRGLLVDKSGRHSTLTINNTKYTTKIIEEYNNLDKIICDNSKIYFIFESRISPNIKISRYNLEGHYIDTSIAVLPKLNWSGVPRVSYFEETDNHYLVQLKEYRRKGKDNENSILLTLDSR